MSKFENVGHELSDAQLSTVQGGGLGSWIKGAVDTVGNAISDGAQAIATGFTNVIMSDVKRLLRGHWFRY